MRQQFYIRNASDGQWQKINGEEFHRLVSSAAGKGRFFIDLDDITIEASEAEYKDWKKEKDHSDYLAEQAEGWQELSIYSDDIGGYEGCDSGEEALADESIDVEQDAIRNTEKEALRLALKLLDAASYQLIYAMYLSEHRKSGCELAVEHGVSHNTIYKRKNKILEFLKKLVEKPEKSSQ